jgi:hypothetical protein
MSKLIDPAVIDERDPLRLRSRPDSRNGFKTSPESSRYTPVFLELYRAAQRERVKRIDQQARRLLAVGEAARAAVHDGDQDMLKIARAAALQAAMIVYRTSADPASNSPSTTTTGRTAPTRASAPTATTTATAGSRAS